MSQVVLEFVSVEMSFTQDRRVLHQVNFLVGEGDRIAIVGPSGSGKSSLLKLGAGLLNPTSGKVLIHGDDWSQMDDVMKQRHWQKTGMLFQKNALFDSMSVSENVAFPLRKLGHFDEKEIQDKVQFFLDGVGLLHVKDLYPDEISGGMQKRLGIARALALEPQLIFYDDPTAGLDPITSRTIVDLILKFQSRFGSTILAVTNDIQRAAQLGERIFYVADGKVVNLGSMKEAMENRDPVIRRFLRGEVDPTTTPAL